MAFLPLSKDVSHAVFDLTPVAFGFPARGDEWSCTWNNNPENVVPCQSTFRFMTFSCRNQYMLASSDRKHLPRPGSGPESGIFGATSLSGAVERARKCRP